MIEPLNNSNPDRRQALVTALMERGLDAQEECSGGNVWHVSLYLLRESQDWLAISTAADKTACDVGLMGERGGRTAGEACWEPVVSVAEAADAFERRWYGREDWIAGLRVGGLDL